VWNCCVWHPFSPLLEPSQGGDICSLAGLTWPHVIIPATISSLQYRHGAPLSMVPCAEAPHPVGFYPVGGLLSEPCQYIPCPVSPTTWSCVFIACHNINNINNIMLTAFRLNCNKEVIVFQKGG